MKFPQFVLVIGGASSGKSRFAETVVLGSGRSPVYLATALPEDDEMREKISLHRARRSSGWLTVEEPLEVDRVISSRASGEIVLLECATLWLLNQMSSERDPEAASGALIRSIAEAPCPVVVVSNEIGLGVVPSDSFSRTFLSRHGELNRTLSKSADSAILIVAGLPFALKGEIPR